MELLCGPANSGKTGVVLRRFVAACPDPGAWLIVPTRADVARAQRELVERHGTLFGGYIATFTDLARELTPWEPELDLPRGADALIARRALARVADVFPAARQPGFEHGWMNDVLELRRGVLAGEALADLAAPLTDAELHAWQMALDAWQAQLERYNVIDEPERTARAIRAAREGQLQLPVIVYGFDDFNELQLQLLEALAATTEVVISFPWVAGRLAFARRTAIVDRLRKTVHARVDHGGEPSFSAPQLIELESALFEPTAAPLAVGDDPAISFVDVSGTLQEVDEVVREVLAARARGVPAEHIACIAPDPAPLRSLLAGRLERAGIAASVEVPRRFEETPGGRALIDLLEAIAHTDVERMLAFLRSPMSPVAGDDVDDWEFTLRRSCGGVLASVADDWITQPIVPGFIQVLLEHRNDVRAALVDVVAQMPTQDIGASRVRGSAVEALDALSQLPGIDPLTLEDAIAMLRALTVAPRNERVPGAVLVAPITRVRTDRFDTVIVFGMHGGAFGSSRDEDEHLIADELLYVAVTRPQQHLVVIRRAADDEGAVLAPHPTWLELRRLCPPPREQRGGEPAAPGFAARVRSLSDVAGARDVAIRPREEVTRLVARAMGESRAITSDHGCSTEIAATQQRVIRGAEDPDAGDSLAALVAQRGRVSVTDIETYMQCPARWFVDRQLLRADPDGPRADGVVGSLVHGLLAQILPDWARRDVGLEHPERAATQLDARLREELPIVVEEYIASQRQRGGDIGAPREPNRYEQEQALFLAARKLRSETWYAAKIVTEEVVGKGVIPALSIAGMPVSGRIDRIDIADDNTALLVDYKTSAVTQGTHFLAKGVVQLALYWRALEASTLTPIGALYRSLRKFKKIKAYTALESRGVLDDAYASATPGPHTRGDAIAAEDARALIAEVVEAAEQVVESMRAGKAATAPIADTCPDWCTLHGICRREVR